MSYVANGVKIDGHSGVKDSARAEDKVTLRKSFLYDQSVAKDRAVIENSTLTGNTCVSDLADVLYSELSVEAKVRGNAFVQNSDLFGNVTVEDSAEVDNCIMGALGSSGPVRVYGNAVVKSIKVLGPCVFFGNAKISPPSTRMKLILDDCKFGGNASLDALKTPEDIKDRYGESYVRLERNGEDVNVYLTGVWDMG